MGSRRRPRKNRDAPAYLKFVASMSCMHCMESRGVVAHHHGPRGIGIKADDYHTVPLCPKCHRYFHDHGVLPGRTKEATELDHWKAQAFLLVQWLRMDEAKDATERVVRDEDVF
jgi:hypothetical protein